MTSDEYAACDVRKSENIDTFEPVFRQILCRPLMPWIPRWVHPNHITIFNLVGLCAGLVAAMAATGLDQYTMLSFSLRVFSAFSILVAAVLDCIDGDWARYTNQCSQFGEILDHWMDSWSAAVTVCITATAIEADNFSIALSILLLCWTYNAEVKLHYIIGVDVAPQHSGVKGQFSAFCFIIGAAIIIAVLGRDHWITATVLLVACVIMHFGQATNVLFYFQESYRRGVLRRLLRLLLPYALVTSIFMAIYLREQTTFDPWHGCNVMRDTFAWRPLHWMTPLAYMLIMVASSGFSSGMTVVCAVSGRKLRGERTVLFIGALLLGAHLWSLAASAVDGGDAGSSLAFPLQVALRVLPYACGVVITYRSTRFLLDVASKLS